MRNVENYEQHLGTKLGLSKQRKETTGQLERERERKKEIERIRKRQTRMAQRKGDRQIGKARPREREIE